MQHETAVEEIRAMTPARASSERFIPVDRHEIHDKLLSSGIWAPHEQRDAQTVLSYIARLRQQDSLINLDELSTLYDDFNPDDETVNDPAREAEDKTEKLKLLTLRLRALFESANFTSINEQQLEKILKEASPSGVEVDVDLTEFDLTILYFRGDSKDIRSRRDWDTFFLEKTYVVDVFRRFVMAVKLKSAESRIAEIMEKEGISRKKAEKRLKKLRASLPKGVSSDKIYIKMFKYIPQQDLEMLFPNTKIKLRYWDKVRLWITAGGGTAAGVFTTATKVLATAALSPILLAMALFGLIGVIFRQVMNLINTRTKYMMQLAQNLYFHNLANNQSVLALLIDEAEEENIKEEILLYTALLKGSQTPGQLQRAKLDVEAFLKAHWNVIVDFDVHDAFRRLREDGLVSGDPDGIITVMPLAEAKNHLWERWVGLLNKSATPLAA